MTPTPKQLGKIHLMLQQMKMLDQKESLILEFTNNRETSSKNMTFDEAANLIAALTHAVKSKSPYDPLDRMRSKVFALAYDAGIIWGDSPEDKRMNTAKLTAFILKSGAVKKELNKMNKKELIKMVNQFAMIVKRKGQSDENKATTSMLAELDIAVTKKGVESPFKHRLQTH